MSDTVIQVENLGKKYIISHQQERHASLREAITHNLDTLKGWLNPNAKTLIQGPSAEQEEFWALKDVSFEVKQGDRVGIIGRNGAGKSTLLKILSRITEPTTGRIKIKGRVASLLEVGTGFHPELTGRENIFLNGAILGMSKAEISRKFDEIVAFAEIEKFLDTPVKRYSSGMYVRLAFAVAAHLEPEILIVDEVLTVGDIQFQKRCFKKMEDIAKKDGRTIFFVSHNMQAMANLCDRIVWLDRGRIISVGNPHEQVAKYTTAMSSFSITDFVAETSYASHAVVQNIRIVNHDDKECEYFDLFEDFAIELDVIQRCLEKPLRLVIRIRLEADNSVVLATTSWDISNPINCLESCQYTIKCFIPGNFLNSGLYTISLGIDEPNGPIHFRLDNAKKIVIINKSSFGEGIYGDRDGIVSPYREWKLVSIKPIP